MFKTDILLTAETEDPDQQSPRPYQYWAATAIFSKGYLLTKVGIYFIHTVYVF